MEKEKIFTRSFNLLFGMNFLTRTVTYLINTVFPLYILFLGGRATVAGLVVSCVSVATLLARPFVGKLIDRAGTGVVLVSTSVVCVLCAGLLRVSAWMGAIVFAMIVRGVAIAALTTVTSAKTNAELPKSRLREGIGYFALSVSLSTAVGPLLAQPFLDSEQFMGAFDVSVALSALALLAAATVTRGERRASAEKSPPHTRRTITAVFWDLVERSAVKPGLVGLLFWLGKSSVTVFIALFAAQTGVGSVAMFSTFNAIGSVMSRVVGGKLLRNLSERAQIMPPIAGMALTLALLPFASSAWVFYALGALYGFCNGLTLPCVMAKAVSSAPEARKGAANATNYLAEDIGSGIGAALWGAMIDYCSYPALFLCSSACVLCALALSWRIFAGRTAIVKDTGLAP